MKKPIIVITLLFCSLQMFGQNGRRQETGEEKITSAIAGAIIFSVIIWFISRKKEKKQEDNYKQNLESAKNINQVNPNDYNSLFTLAIENYKNDNYDTAFEYFEKCYKLNKSKIENLIFIGNIYHLKGEQDNLLIISDIFNTEFDKNDKYVNTLLTSYKIPLAEFQYFLGYAFFCRGNKEQAKSLKKTAINLYPEVGNSGLY